ncbi:hypothetical protein Tco_0933369 [Tanacetum coccineum]
MEVLIFNVLFLESFYSCLMNLRASAATLASPRHAKIGARQSFYITVERLPLLFLPIRISHFSESVWLEDPSFSSTNNIGAPQGEELSLTNPFEYTTYYARDDQLSFSQHITCLRVSSYPAPTYQSYQQLGILATIDAYPLLLLLRVVKVSSPKGSMANSIEYLVSTVDGTMLLKGLILTGVRLLSTRFHVPAIIVSIALTSGPSEVSSVRESHNLRDSNS